MALQNCAIETMNKFLNNTFYIPNYQREYSWEKAELEAFWEDLQTTKESSDSLDHFFGQIVVHSDETTAKKYIIDGQQRTITSTIFMRTLQYFYTVIYKETDSERADSKKADIAAMHIGRYLSSANDTLHLHLGELDNDYFRTTVQLGSPENTTKVKKKSHERLRKAYLFFYEQLKEKGKDLLDTDERLDMLDKYYDAFTNRFKVLYMEATKLDEAFVIFETLNARGKELETADLLKNFIFSQSRDVSLAQKQWNTMMSTLDHADPTKYIRHYWNSAEKFAREKDLYSNISKEISSPRASKALLENLANYAQCYHDISNPNENVGFTDIALINSLKALKILKASSFYPVILAMKQKNQAFKEKDIREVTQVIETYVFRNFTICGKVANKSEVFFANVAKEICDEILDTPALIVGRIKSEMVGDKEFEDSFVIWAGSNSTKEAIRYILRKIHKYNDSAHELNIDNTEVHIEHIMPEDNTQWQVPEEVHETYLWRLGNLALLSGPVNISISNKPYDIKKTRYTDSKIEPNKELATHAAWTSVEIEARQKQFAGYALKIWAK